jgi:hypothetical protein
MASAKAIQALCQTASAKNIYIFQIFISVDIDPKQVPYRIQKMHPHIFCAAHKC